MKPKSRKEKKSNPIKKISDSSKKFLRENLRTSVASLHSLSQAQLRMNKTFSLTASNISEQMTKEFMALTQDVSAKKLTTDPDKIADEIQKAWDESDRFDPFGTDFGGKAGFGGKQGDFPSVCFKNYKERMGNLIKEEAKYYQKLKNQGDPNAQQKASNKYKNQKVKVVSDYLQCLNHPPKKK